MRCNDSCDIRISANPVDLCAQSDPTGAPEPMKIEPGLGTQLAGYRASGDAPRSCSARRNAGMTTLLLCGSA